MIVSSFSPFGRYPLYSVLATTLSLCALLAGLSLWGSIESQRQFDAVTGQLLNACLSGLRQDAACQTADALNHTLRQRMAVLLLLQSLCCALIMLGAALIAQRGYRVLVRRTRDALDLCPPAARERGRDEVDTLIESLAELTAHQTGLDAQERWRQQLDSEQLHHNAQVLQVLYQLMRLFGQDDVSAPKLLGALRLLEVALGAKTVALRLQGSARDTLGAGTVLATRSEPRLIATLADTIPGARDCGARVVSPTEGCPVYSLLVPLQRHGAPLGTLVAEFADTARVDNTQIHLADGFAQLAALAISSLSRIQEERRIALMEERGAIAAELHDSLAQSLAFMKIQLARLQTGLDRDANAPEVHQTVAELREGLAAAYHEVRELISTFRVSMGPGGLRAAVQETIEEFSQRSGLDIVFDDGMDKCQLEVNEEFHVLQLMREAIANAVRHAFASHVWVAAHYSADHQFTVTIDDDGRGDGRGDGLDGRDAEIGHYGVTIMRERARSLGGTLTIEARSGSGTRVRLNFAPQRFPIDSPTGENAA